MSLSNLDLYPSFAAPMAQVATILHSALQRTLDSQAACSQGNIMTEVDCLSVNTASIACQWSAARATCEALNALSSSAIRVATQLTDDYGADQLNRQEKDVIKDEDSMSLYGIDIGAFLVQWIGDLQAYGTDETDCTRATAERALVAYEAMIVYERHTRNVVDDYTGMHLFFPVTPRALQFAGRGTSAAVHF